MINSWFIYFLFCNNMVHFYCILSPNDLGSNAKVEKKDRNNEIK